MRRLSVGALVPVARAAPAQPARVGDRDEELQVVEAQAPFHF